MFFLNITEQLGCGLILVNYLHLKSYLNAQNLWICYMVFILIV